MSKNKRLFTAIICIAVVFCALIVFIAYENKNLETNFYTIESDNLPKSFDSFKIAQVSDLHNDEIGKENIRLLSALKNAQPDIIAVTGDIYDSRRTDIDVAVSFIDEALKIAPCYYINGNNESRKPEEYEKLKSELSSLGVVILENDSVKIDKGDDCITIAGVNDPVFYADIVREGLTETIIRTTKDIESYTILLSHRPELFDLYVKYDYDLVLTGHAHGGQFRLPFVGGIFAPHQGFFPEYDSGLYEEADTKMLVSRGIGNSIFPLRVNNRPEIIIAELKAK